MFNSSHLLDCLLYCHSSLCSSIDSLDPWTHFAGSSEGDNVLCHARLVETFGWTGYSFRKFSIYSIKRRPCLNDADRSNESKIVNKRRPWVNAVLVNKRRIRNDENSKNTVAFDRVNTVNSQVQNRCHVSIGRPPLCSLFIYQINKSSSLMFNFINARIVFYLSRASHGSRVN